MKQFYKKGTNAITQLFSTPISKKQIFTLPLFVLGTMCTTMAQNTLDRIGLSAGTLVEGAYSIRLLSSDYTGQAIEVRRLSGTPTVINIGFTASGDLDTTTLKTFAGSGDAFVTKWYDQSGYGRIIVQTTINKQPKIVSAGILQKNVNRPAIFFDGADDVLSNSFNAGYPISISLIASTPGVADNGAFIKWGSNDRGMAIGIGNQTMDNNSSGRNLIILKEQVKWAYSTPANLLGSSAKFSTILTQGSSSGSTRPYLNGNSVSLDIPNDAPKNGGLNGGISVGGYSGSANEQRYPIVRESEIILFSEILSLEKRTTLECNQFSYFNMKLIPDQNITVCSGEEFFINTIPAIFNWGLPVLSGAITGASAGTNATNFSQRLFNGTGTNQTATYTVTPTCKGAPFTITVTVKPFSASSVDINADYCSIGGGKVKLKSVPTTFSNYLWSNNSNKDSIIIDQSGIYSLSVVDANGCKASKTINIGNELITNGNFSLGQGPFTSGHTYTSAPGGLQTNGAEGKYAIGTNATTYHSQFFANADHTSGNGNFMIINAKSGISIWQTTINVIPNTKYYFSAWALSLNDVFPFAQLQFNINGVNSGTSPVLPSGPRNILDTANLNKWQRFFGVWESGTNSGSITIKIVNLEPSANGNDFAIDDVSFSTLPPISFLSVTLGNGGNSVCTGGILQLTSNIQGGTSPIVYNWKDPNGNPLSGGNNVVPNPLVNSPIPGLYSLSAVDGAGCPVNASIDIVIGNPTLTAVGIRKKLR